MIHRRRLRSRSPSSRVVHRRRSPSRTVHRRRSPSSSSSRVVHHRRSPLRAVHRRASPLRAVHRHRSPVHRRGSSRAVHRRASPVHRHRAMSTSPVRIHLKSIGALSRFGYAAHESMHARHAALLEAARHNGATEVVKRLNVLYIYNKNHHPALAKLFRSDLHWLQRQRDTGVVA